MERLEPVTIDRMRRVYLELLDLAENATCPECHGRGAYWAEWSDAAESEALERRIIVLHRPDPPDGTVCVACTICGNKEKET